MARIAARYAKALFKLANGDLAKAKKQAETLRILNELFEYPESNRILRSPVMPATLKKNILDYGLSQAQASEAVSHLIGTIVEVGRVPLIPAIIGAYDDLLDAAEGVARAEVASALPLPSEDLEAISGTLSRILGRQRVEIKQVVEPALLGGFVARVGNYRIDMSLKTKLDGLSQRAVQDTLR